MRCGSCGFDHYVIVNGRIGCGQCGQDAPYGFKMDQLVLPDDACVSAAAIQTLTLAALQVAYLASDAQNWKAA